MERRKRREARGEVGTRDVDTLASSVCPGAASLAAVVNLSGRGNRKSSQAR